MNYLKILKKNFILLLFIATISFNCSSIYKCNMDNNTYPYVHPAGKVLLVIAHQDDEVFILSRIKKHLELKDSVFFVWTAASYQKDEEYKNIRIEESLSLMKLLKIPYENIYFLSYPDSKTHLFMDSMYIDLYKIIKKIRPTIVYVPAFEGGHIDHDVANVITIRVTKQLKLNTQIFEFPEYSSYNTPFFLPFKMRAFPDTLETHCRELKNNEYNFILDSWDIYRSQHFPLNYYIGLFSTDKVTFGYEYIRKIPEYDYYQQPDYGVAYESFLDVSFEDFKSALLKLNQLNIE